MLASKGESDLSAYKQAFKCTRDVAISNAWRMREIEGILNRIAFMQRASQSETHLSMKERRDFLARAVRARLHEIDMEKDGDLIQEIIDNEQGRKIKLPGKRECIMDDAKLAGELIERQDHTTAGEALPAIQFILPDSFVKRRGK